MFRIDAHRLAQMQQPVVGLPQLEQRRPQITVRDHVVLFGVE
jgi:hypothetical protein